ncbi:hypothetical protein [Bradyrhizobium sp. BR13661]|uniref:hypothetical protein n=1 Tax=Bradyrhizobium sp. BR13661 TaxID=2940622 RepID=UPI0024763CF9|nr:hypothetical protein [Bradyrhizobium sp. BR13661]
MEAASNVGEMNMRHDAGVVAASIQGETFADIAVDGRSARHWFFSSDFGHENFYRCGATDVKLD